MAFYIYRDPHGYWRWYLLGAHHRRIAESGEGYFTVEECRAAIDVVKGSGGAPVHKV